MRHAKAILLSICGGVCLAVMMWAQEQNTGKPPVDAVVQVQQPSNVQIKRPEQRKNAHDDSDVFDFQQAKPSSPVFADQPKKGQNSGFDFYRDPLNSDRPAADPDEIMSMLSAQKPSIMAAQRRLLESPYILEPRLDPQAKMSRGKPLVVGPTARLRQEIRERDLFPYPSLPHPLHTNGGQVFPKM